MYGLKISMVKHKSIGQYSTFVAFFSISSVPKAFFNTKQGKYSSCSFCTVIAPKQTFGAITYAFILCGPISVQGVKVVYVLC